MTIDLGNLSNPRAFVLANTRPSRPPLLPELDLLLASELVPLWRATEADLAASDLPPPYWAFAWSGGQALARYVLDTPEIVAGRAVLDFGTGAGLVAIAAAKAGAESVTAADIDAFAVAACRLNADRNGVDLQILHQDLTDGAAGAFDVVLAGDICYEQPMAERAVRWLRRLAADPVRPAVVLIGDPGRNHLPRPLLRKRARYSVPTTTELEDSDLRNAVVWELTA